jgi:hypothetical protein
MIEAKLECPRCKGELSLELPDKDYEADYSIECPNCNEQFLINVEKLHKQEPVVEWEKRKKIVRKDPTLLIKPRYSNRLRVATAFLVLAFVLGLTTGILTSLYGFIIPNPDIFFETETTKISGSIIDMEGDAMEGVTVSVMDSSFSDVSNSLGIYLIEAVPVGDYTIKVEMAGYRTVILKITATAGQPNIHDIVLKRGDPADTEEMDKSREVTEKGGTLITVTTIAAILFSSLFALLGAYLVFTRQRFLFAVGCAVLGIMSIGFGIGSVLCVVTLVLLISSKQGFNS